MKTLALLLFHLLLLKVTLENVTMFDTTLPWNFSLYKDIFNTRRSSVDNEDDFVSCEGNCGRSSKARCSCDESCSILNNCCKDYFINCVPILHRSTVSSPEMQSLSTALILYVHHRSLRSNKISKKQKMSSAFDKDISSAFNKSEDDNVIALLKEAYRNISSVHSHTYNRSISSMQETIKQYPKSRTSNNDKNELKKEYVTPMILCTEDRLILISSCYNYPDIDDYETNDHETDNATNSYRGVRLLRSPSSKNFHFENSDESNFFPVTDLSTGYTYASWSIFVCFEQMYSRPLFWSAYMKELKIKQTQSYLYVIVEFEEVFFEWPKNKNLKVTLRRCVISGVEIFEKTDISPKCKQCQNYFSIYSKYLNYTIQVLTFKSYLTFISSDKSSPWSELECKNKLDKVTIYPQSYLNCTITHYRSNFVEHIRTTEQKTYAVKLAIASKFLRAYNTELFSQTFICLLRHYANINVLKLWRPTILTFFEVNKADYLVMKILIHDYLIFQNNNRTEIRQNLETIFNMIFVLNRNEKLFSGNRTGYVEVKRSKDLPELWSLVDFGHLKFINSNEDVVCGCSVTLKELSTFKYLEEWLCDIQCEMFVFDQENDTNDLSDMERKCFAVNKSPETNHDSVLQFFDLVFFCYFLSSFQ